MKHDLKLFPQLLIADIRLYLTRCLVGGLGTTLQHTGTSWLVTFRVKRIEDQYRLNPHSLELRQLHLAAPGEQDLELLLTFLSKSQIGGFQGYVWKECQFTEPRAIDQMRVRPAHQLLSCRRITD